MVDDFGRSQVLSGDWSPVLLREIADAQESREAAVEAEAEAARDAAHPFRIIGNTVRVPFASVSACARSV